MADQQIASELQTPATHGLNSVVRTYTNPNGISRSDPLALAAIEANADMFNDPDIEVYRNSISPDEFFTVLIAEALQGLSAPERDDYAAFIVPMLNSNVNAPETLLKDLVNTLFSGNTGDDVIIRNNYESLIRELNSIAQILNIRAKAGDVQLAMLQLGWIVE